VTAPRIYTGAEARALRKGTTPGPWKHLRYPALSIEAGGYTVATIEDVSDCDGALFAAAPDLAASVEHHAARADAAEKRVAELEAALRDHAEGCFVCDTQGRCRVGVWLYAGFGGDHVGAACDEHRGSLSGWESRANHADVLRSLDAPPALVPCDEVVAQLEGATTEPTT